ncbi:MAG: hypothetical protein M3041_03085 [Acidobacteriota bacterium]|nr:hypothetical protein [Acidobacteriota bacterium]
MKRITIVALTILALACKVEKTGQDTYKVVTPTPEAKAAAEKAKEQAKVVGQEIKQGAADAAVKVGGAMQKAGEKAKSEVNEHTETVTTETTSTIETGTGTKTETRAKTKKHY